MGLIGSRVSTASIVTRLRTGRPGLDSRQGQCWDFFFSSPPLTDRFRCPSNLLSNGHLSAGGKVAGVWSWPLSSL